jgi:hypothetical protein
MGTESRIEQLEALLRLVLERGGDVPEWLRLAIQEVLRVRG